MTIQQGFPSVSYTWVDKAGKLTQPAYQFLIALWNRTGGSSGSFAVELFGDVTGMASDTTVVSTHLTSPLPVTQGGTGGNSAASARTALGLGTMAVQNAVSVLISGGGIDGTPIGASVPAAGHFTTLETSSGNLSVGANNIVAATNTAVAIAQTTGAVRYQADATNSTLYATDGTTPILQITNAGVGVSTPSGFYEFNTFVPTLTFGGGSTGLTFSTQTGVYTRIGRMVTASIRLVLTAVGSSTGSAVIGSLPFSALATTNYAASVSYTNMSAGTGAGIQAVASGTSVNLYSFAAGARAALADTNFTATSTVDLTVTYQI